jgi:hypothetical protein
LHSNDYNQQICAQLSSHAQKLEVAPETKWTGDQNIQSKVKLTSTFISFLIKRERAHITIKTIRYCNRRRFT